MVDSTSSSFRQLTESDSTGTVVRASPRSSSLEAGVVQEAMFGKFKFWMQRESVLLEEKLRLHLDGEVQRVLQQQTEIASIANIQASCLSSALRDELDVLRKQHMEQGDSMKLTIRSLEEELAELRKRWAGLQQQTEIASIANTQASCLSSALRDELDVLRKQHMEQGDSMEVTIRSLEEELAELRKRWGGEHTQYLSALRAEAKQNSADLGKTIGMATSMVEAAEERLEARISAEQRGFGNCLNKTVDKMSFLFETTKVGLEARVDAATDKLASATDRLTNLIELVKARTELRIDAVERTVRRFTSNGGLPIDTNAAQRQDRDDNSLAYGTDACSAATSPAREHSPSKAADSVTKLGHEVDRQISYKTKREVILHSSQISSEACSFPVTPQRVPLEDDTNAPRQVQHDVILAGPNRDVRASSQVHPSPPLQSPRVSLGLDGGTPRTAVSTKTVTPQITPLLSSKESRCRELGLLGSLTYGHSETRPQTQLRGTSLSLAHPHSAGISPRGF